MLNKTVLVAGAAGFIPSHLSEFYLKKGARVIGIDNYITGSRENIELLKKYPLFEFYEENIFENLPNFDNISIDYIFSMASPASPIDFSEIPFEIMRVNSEGTYKLLKLAKEKGARFLEASTSEVYGDPEIHPQREDYWGRVNPIGPRSCYDESKRYAESLTVNAQRFWGVDTRIIRIFNTYGPRMRPNDGRVIPNFINQAIRGEDITIYGDGLQTRSFCYVSDLVDAIDKVMFSEELGPFNIGNPDEYTILDCANTILKVLSSSSKIIFRPLPTDDPKKRRPDLTKLAEMTGYSPQVGFEDGIRMTAEYFRSLV